MKLRKFFFFTLVFAALVFCISCKGKNDPYADLDDDIIHDDSDTSADTAPDSDDDTGDTTDDNTDTAPDDDTDTDTGDHDNIPDESHETDPDPVDDSDSQSQDEDTDEPEDDPSNDDDADTEEQGDEDSIPEKDDPETICTGQTQCFSSKQEISCPSAPEADFFGQDAQYANKGYCLNKSFSTTNDLVTDNISGLIWQRKLPEEGCPNHGDGTNVVVCTKQEAVNYCNNLNLAGFDDWRLPTPEEFATIKNFGSVPAIHTTADTEYFPLPASSVKTFWTGSSSGSSGKSWSVDFLNGETKDDQKDSTALYVRCVRGEELAKPVFKTFPTDEGEEIVYDYTNELRWTKTFGEEMTWKQALKYCENLEYANEKDWRLPNINELASLVDYSISGPASEFPGLILAYFWSSTSYAGYPSQAWTTDMTSGTVKIYNGKTYSARVICVK
jgi:hypothetical protein